MNNIENGSATQNSESSSVAGMSRREFIDTTIKRALIAGTVLATAATVDTFLVRPAYATTSTQLGTGSNPSDTGNFG